jgi:dipeptidyl aminopeptidase/acylaminoacyl peptidase
VDLPRSPRFLLTGLGLVPALFGLLLTQCTSLEGLAPTGPTSDDGGDEGAQPGADGGGLGDATVTGTDDAGDDKDAADGGGKDTGGDAVGDEAAPDAGGCMPTGPAAGLDPVWILIDSDRDEVLNRDLYAIRADGCGVRRITTDAYIEQDGVVAPDGKHIAFASDQQGNHLQLYVLDLSTGVTTKKTSLTTGSVGHPSWSPDGTMIAFTNTPDSGGDGMPDEGIWIVKVDGTDPPLMFKNSIASYSPSWGPNGIAATSGLYTYLFDPTMMDAMPMSLGDCLVPNSLSLSPDGHTIALARWDYENSTGPYASAILSLLPSTGGCADTPLTTVGDGDMRSVAFGPHTLIAAANQATNRIVLVKVGTAGLFTIPASSSAVEKHPSFAPATYQ